MKVTFDTDAQAAYIYFKSIGPGEAAETITELNLMVGFDLNNQIAVIRLFENDDCQFRNRVKYATGHDGVTFDEETRSISISFCEDAEISETIGWYANIDLDTAGQLLGIEILFADREYKPDDGTKTIYAQDKLQHVAKYIVPSNSLY